MVTFIIVIIVARYVAWRIDSRARKTNSGARRIIASPMPENSLNTTISQENIPSTTNLKMAMTLASLKKKKFKSLEDLESSFLEIEIMKN